MEPEAGLKWPGILKIGEESSAENDGTTILETASSSIPGATRKIGF